ncbi:MAG TPA: helix-turn-helix domain-containing protein [Rubrobacteraceae bacterium]|nr:helix-turn-helix domain-containing protein [Rubrobacteraceae bacterium]
MNTPRQEKKERNFSNVRRRTREAMIDAATRLVREGASPSVTEVADAAGVSRATAYRYFPTQESLLAEVIVPDLEAALAAEALPEDLKDRFGAAFTTIWSSNITHEAAYRTILRRGLERPSGESIEHEEEAGSIRAGRRVRWLRNALEPAREWMDEESFKRLVAAMCLCIGIESLVVLRDVCDLKAKEAEEVARWAAFTLLRASLGESESIDGGRSGRGHDAL